MSIQAQSFKVIDEAILAASQKVMAELISGLEAQQRVVLLLAGGSATKIYAQLVTDIARQQPKLAWNKLSIAIEDERWPEKNNEADILKTNFIQTLQNLGAYYFQLNSSWSESQAAEAMSDWLNKQFKQPTTKIIAIIGIGADGHTISVNADQDEARFKTLFASDKTVISYHSEALTAQFPAYPNRVTLTLTGLKHVDCVIGLVAGPDKAAMLEQLLQENLPTHQMPAQALKALPTYLFLA